MASVQEGMISPWLRSPLGDQPRRRTASSSRLSESLLEAGELCQHTPFPTPDTSSVWGARVAALFYSLIESAKLCGVEPRGYLREATLRAVRNPSTVTLARDLKSSES